MARLSDCSRSGVGLVAIDLIGIVSSCCRIQWPNSGISFDEILGSIVAGMLLFLEWKFCVCFFWHIVSFLIVANVFVQTVWFFDRIREMFHYIWVSVNAVNAVWCGSLIYTACAWNVCAALTIDTVVFAPKTRRLATSAGEADTLRPRMCVCVDEWCHVTATVNNSVRHFFVSHRLLLEYLFRGFVIVEGILQ